MLATPGTLPAGAGWAFELKWDGVRVLADLRDGRTRLLARSGNDVTASYPELAGLAAAIGRDALLDGEVAVLRDDASTDFGALQSRMHVAQPERAALLARQTPVTYLAFDLLRLDGTDLTSRPYTERRRLLAGLGMAGPAWQVPPAFGLPGGEITDPGALLAASRQLGMEGIVAKRLSSPYLPGRRSDQWIKVKNVRTQAVVLGGWSPGQGGRSRTFGALLLGLPRPGAPDGGLRYVGSVGTGFTEAVARSLRERLDGLATASSPFDGPVDVRHRKVARWVRPELVGEVGFAHWTSEGRLRHPTWRGLRPDLRPADVVEE
jgi:bifunctional non-homologous end joining protein LigD